MDNFYVPIANTRRPFKLYIKRNNKKIINPKVITELKKNFTKVELPNKFAWDKKNKKIINLYSGSSNNTSVEFKKINKVDRKNLQYYGNTIYDRNANQLINKNKIYKKDGTLREKYAQYKILKSNQIPTTKTAIKDVFYSFTYTHKVQYKDYTTKDGTKKAGQIQDRSKQFNFTGKSNWSKAKILKKEKELIGGYETELMADSPLSSSSEGNSSGAIGASGASSSGGGYSFALNSNVYLTFDGDTKHTWNTETNKCVYDWVISKYGDINGCKKICDYKTLFYIFKNEGIEPQSIKVSDKEKIEQFFNSHLLTEDKFNKLIEKTNDPYANFLVRDNINGGGIYGAGELLEMVEEEDQHKIYTTYENYLKLLWGVSPKQINNFCKYLNIPHYCLDNQDKVLHYYYPTQRNTTNKIPSMVYKISGGHIHPISDPKKIKSLGQLCSDLTKSQSQKIEEANKDKQKQKIVEIINCKDRIAYLINKMVETKTQVINNKVKVNGDDITSFILNNTKYIFIETDEKDPINYTKIYCELNNIEYYGQSLTSIAMGLLNEHITIKSECNHIVNKILHTDKVKFRTHIGFTNDNSALNIKGNCKAFDISKCYSKCITKPNEEFITFDYNALPQEFIKGNKIVNGLYYIETSDNNLFTGSNLYSKSIVIFGIGKGIITSDNIRWFIPASKTHKKTLFKTLFEEYTANSKDNTELNKKLNNYTTGLMGISKQKKTKFSCSTELNDAFTYLLEHKDYKCYLRQHKGMCVFGNKVSRDLDQHNIPIYIQLLDDSNILLYKLMEEATNGKIDNVLYRKTDCVVVRDPNPLLKLGEGWGEYREEKLPTNYINCDYLHRLPQIEQPKFIFNYQYADIDDSSDYKNIHQTLRCNKGLMINGSAGTGKSYVIKKISEEVGDENVARLCFTNKGAININGQTIHKFLGLNTEGKILASNIAKIKKNIKLIIIDEVSMVSAFLWARLYSLYEDTKIPFLLVGDWKQIPPVEDLKPFNYLQHPAVVELSGGLVIELQKVYRYCDRLKQASNNVMGLDKSKFGNNITKNNICYFNKTRKYVNTLVVNEIIKGTKPKLIVDIKQSKYIKSKNEDDAEFKKRCNKNPTQDIKIFKGMPLIASRTIEQGEICVNNEEFIITELSKDNLTAESIRPDGIHKVNIELKFFNHHFLVAYCITTHKAQGSTIKGQMTLWDWDQMDEKLRYTALTRATAYENVNFVNKIN